MRCFSLLSGKIAEGLLLLLLLRDRTTTTEAFSLGNKKARGSAVVPVAAALLRHRSLHSSNQRHLSLRQQRTYEAAASDVEAVAEVTGEESPPLFPDPLERDFVPAEPTIWERLAMLVVGDITNNNSDNNYSDSDMQAKMHTYVQLVSIFRVGIPALFNTVSAKLSYSTIAMTLAHAINDSGVFAVVAQDASQFIQNVLTTSGLVFSLLVGQTYYFMYQQQEATYLALYEEVTMAKSLLEQVALVCQGRQQLYRRILEQMDRYCRYDLRRFNDVEPAILLSARPSDDPLEDILYLTSVGEPSAVYQTVRALRQARAYRLAALQKKLPSIHMTLLWVLAAIVLFTFPLLGAGVQTIGGDEILQVQSWYLSFIVFGISLVMGVVYELQRPGETGAYNARMVLAVMVTGLEEELRDRLAGRDNFGWRSNFDGSIQDGPSIDGDGSFDASLLLSPSGDYEI